MNERLFMTIIRAVVLFTSMPVHECAHGYAAHCLGDDTAKNQGRLTLNPFVHLDLLGSLLLVFSGFGWAKPVQVDPRNFKKPKRDMALTSLAGPLSNILLATVIMIFYRVLLGALPAYRESTPMMYASVFLYVMISTNLYLAVFNLLPVPPLDGSKIFGAILPERLYFFFMRYERYVAIVLVILVFTGVLSGPLSYLADGLFAFLEFITKPVSMVF